MSVELAPGSVLRFNKLGLDHLSLGEEPAPHQQVEEALNFTPLGSAPLDREPLLSVDLGTAHSAAVTGKQDLDTGGQRRTILASLGPFLPYLSLPLQPLVTATLSAAISMGSWVPMLAGSAGHPVKSRASRASR